MWRLFSDVRTVPHSDSLRMYLSQVYLHYWIFMKCVAYSTAQTSTKALLWSIRGVDSLSVCIALYRSRLPAWQRLLCFHFYCTQSSSIVTDDVIHAALPLKDERLIVARRRRRAARRGWSRLVSSDWESISTCFVRGQPRSSGNQLLRRPTTVSTSTTPCHPLLSPLNFNPFFPIS